VWYGVVIGGQQVLEYSCTKFLTDHRPVVHKCNVQVLTRIAKAVELTLISKYSATSY
jgi:hypothetical protein